MKESQLPFSNKSKINSINSNLRQIPIKFKHNLIALKSLPEFILGSKSFRQQSHYLTTKNSRKKIKEVNINGNQSFEEKSQNKTNANSKNKNKNKINNNYSNTNDLFNTQKVEKVPEYLKNNNIINDLNPYFGQSTNNSIYNKNKKNLNENQKYKLMSCLTGFVQGYKGIFKGYNTANNTANNSICESIEKNNINKEENKNSKSKVKKNMIKSIKPIYLKSIETQKKNKISQTANNSRENSGNKHKDIIRPKLMSFKQNKLILKNIGGLNNNNINIKSKNKIKEAQAVNKNNKKNVIVNLKKKKNNNCQTKNHLLRKYNQDTMKSFNTNINEKIKVSSAKFNNYNTNSNDSNFKMNNLLNLNNFKPNSVFSTRQNLKNENPLIKVNKSNKLINGTNSNNNNLSNGISFYPRYNHKNFKKFGILNVNEKSIEIFKKKGQKIISNSSYFNKLKPEINKKIMTAGNSPAHSKTKKVISKCINSKYKEINIKNSYQNVNQVLTKDKIQKNNGYKIPNLKSACITRKNSKNKELKENFNLNSDYKNIKNEIYCNDSFPKNSLRSVHSNDKDYIIENNLSKYNSKYYTNSKNSLKVFNSIINIGYNYKNKKNNKQNVNNNSAVENINEINNMLIHLKNDSGSNKILKQNAKNNNFNNSPNYFTKYNNLYEKNKINISDNNYQLNSKIDLKSINLSREKSAFIINKKNKTKKTKISQGNSQNKLNSKELNKNINETKKKAKNKNLINKSKIEQILLQKEINKSKKINIKGNIKNDDDLLNSNRNNQENSSRSKMAKKSTHNRNIEQNSIFNSNNTNTSLLSTMKDSNYYSQESENLSKYIKDYYKSHSSYPKTDISFYKFGRVIGRGAFGKVNIGLNILTGRIVAIKSFNKQNLLNEKAKKKILYETNLMRGLYHPSVTKILETFETDKYMLIIMEYISGGNLQNFVKKRRKLCEKTAKILYRQIIQGIKYIHSKGIVHRDIKLENILLDLNNIVKICDFGVGKLTQKGQKLMDQCGTPVYMAPEIIKGDGYEGFPVDVWSSGVALYIMLSGNIPFNRDKTHDLQSAIMNLPYKKIDDISDNANDLLQNILEKNPNKRLTPDEILEHPWMNEGNDDDGSDYNYDFEIKNVNKYHLFTNAESILLAKTHIDYRKAPKKDLAENFTIKNLYTIEDKKNNKNIETKSIILAPYNSMITDTEEEEEEDEEKSNNKIKKNKDKEKSKTKLETIQDIKLKALNYYNQSTNPYDILDNFNLEIEVKNGIIKFHGKVKECNMNYELNNNGEIDNGMLINSKDDLVLNDNNEDQLENYVKNNKSDLSNKENNKSKKSHRPTSPYRQPPINPYFVKMVCELGYDEDYIVNSLKKNELNHATTIYYLFSNYENIK